MRLMVRKKNGQLEGRTLSILGKKQKRPVPRRGRESWDSGTDELLIRLGNYS